MDDKELLTRIQQLVQEEHDLTHKEEAGELEDPDHQRMHSLEVALDQCWDLVRQRRARRDMGMDPDEAKPRDPQVVEGYLQ